MPERAQNHTKTGLLPKVLPKMFYYVQFNLIKCLVPNCRGAKLSGAKLSWCQIVMVPNCPGAKLSTFIILVPNCLLLLSWCQIVPFIILVPNCPVLNCPTIFLGHPVETIADFIGVLMLADEVDIEESFDDSLTTYFSQFSVIGHIVHYHHTNYCLNKAHNSQARYAFGKVLLYSRLHVL